MKHITAIIIKFIMTVAILEISLLLLSDLSAGNIFWISLVLTVVSYVIGDMVILPGTNNFIATIADIGLAFAAIYLFNFVWNTVSVPILNALVAGALLGVGEWYFHKIINTKVDELD